MPLILICGYPSSGKSTIANKLKNYFENEKQKKVKIASENDIVGTLKNEIFEDSKKEKPVRSALRADVDRFISRENVVILDALNYIKSFRYELHCVVKSEKTLHCIVHCGIPKETCWEWNLNRPEEERYSETIFNHLVMRFECPDGRNRWDSPLFTKLQDIELNFEDIHNALYNRQAPPPNQSTLPTPISSGNFMRDLDQATQNVITEVLDMQKTAMIGDSIKISGSTERLKLIKTLNMAELRRVKRQFITYAKMHPVEDITKLKNMFVQFLNNSIH